MAKKYNTIDKKTLKDIEKLSTAFNDAYRDLPHTDTNPAHDAEIGRIDKSITDIVRAEINNTKSLTTDDMSVFLVKLFNEMDGGNNTVKSIEDIFQADDEGLIQFFQDRYTNRNMYYEDLDMICTQLYEMDEAVMTSRDAVITADDMSQTISRTLTFSDRAKNDDIATYISSIDEMERKLRLPSKIKNFIVPNTLKYGEYYVYTIPYAKLFEQQYRYINHDVHTIGKRTMKESVVSESFVSDLKTDIKSAGYNISMPDDKLKSTMEDYFSNIEVLNDVYSIPLVEGQNVSGLLDDPAFRKIADEKINKVNADTSKYADSTYDKNCKEETFDDVVNDCYIRFIDPRRIIPIKILDAIVGYYYIHESELKVNKAPFSTTIRVTNSNTSGVKSDDIEAVFLSKITDKIVASFDKNMVKNNPKLKELILNSLMYNDIYNRQLTFQFIPKEYITEFKVNEDENGNGQSILKRSLFYAKLYLSLLVFKMVSIINRSSDTRVYYIKNSGLDANMTNKLQDVARSIKGRQINFMDLLNYNSIISRIGKNKELFIPTGRSGEKGIDFDILSGQDIQLNTDLMEKLWTNMINGTGVPSVIMNFINEADFAKTLQMANSKFLGRTISYQMDFNPSITELYQKLVKYTNVQIPEDIVEQLIFRFNPPKTLNNINSSDIISVADQIVSAIIKAKIGEAESDDTTNILRDKMYDTLIREYLPMVDWALVDKAYETAKIDSAKHINNKANDTE